MKTPPSPTRDTYFALQRAFNHFNWGLVRQATAALPHHPAAHARRLRVFFRRPFPRAMGERTADEIAMNPNHIGERSAEATLSTLAHEMAHLWQHHFGKPSRNGYHNREWGRQMREIGLVPTATGAPGGKETGPRMSHMIEPNGAFAHSCEALITTGAVINWHDPHVESLAARMKRNTRAKFTCPGCGQNAWAKPGAALACSDCDEHMIGPSPEAIAGLLALCDEDHPVLESA